MGNLIIILILAAIVAGITVKMVKDKKSGKSSCGCGCASCALRYECHKK